MTHRLLAGLNPAQQQAVQVLDGPTLVLAGPGSGKTGVLTRRVAYLADVVGIDLHHILAVTFTNKAAREMKERIDGLLGFGRSGALTAGTFHSLCARFLRRDISHLGRERDFVIYDSDDQQRLMKRVLKDLNLDEKKNPYRAIHSAISSAKNELVGVEEYKRQARTYQDEIVARCFARYQELLREANALDFDDLLVETVRLFEQHPVVLEKYQERYRYILADEYQDTNRAQYLFLKLLAAKYRNLFAVGDEDQGIYAFRGADIRNIRAFENDYPEAQIILLEQNYRSTQAILDVAQAVINRSLKRVRGKKLWTENEQGKIAALYEGYDETDEARLAVHEATRLISSGEFRANDIAIMYRTNAQSRAVEEALIGQGVPYQIVGGTRFYERKEVKDALAYVRLIHNPFDSVSMLRVLNWPGRGIGQRTEDELTRWSSEQGVPIYASLQLLADPEAHQPTSNPFTGRTQTALVAFVRLLDSFITVKAEHDLTDLMKLVFSRLGFEEALLKEYGEEEGRDRWNNVQELLNSAANYINIPRENQLAMFLEEVALVADVDAMDPNKDTLTCITLHQAKGLEYPVVFLLGLEEGLLPHSRSLDDGDALDEERRLFYVGATRAKQRLYLLYAFRRTQYGRTNSATPSRFLGDIPRELLQSAAKRGQITSQQTSMFTERSLLQQRRALPAVGANQTQPRHQTALPDTRNLNFFAGQHVQHATFGAGIVITSKLTEDDEEVTVAFSGKGVKRLLASFAHLEHVKP